MSAPANVRKFCDAIGIEIVPTTAAPGPRQTTGPNIIRRLLAKHGEGHASMVLKAIVDSDGNEAQLRADVILAVSDVLERHPRWPSLGLAFLEAMDQVDLGAIRRQVKASGIKPLRNGIGTLLFLRLQELLGPPVLPKRSKPGAADVAMAPSAPQPCAVEARAADIQRRVAIGVDLIALKAIAPHRQFGRLAHARHGIDSQIIPEYLQIARLYGARPDVTSKLAWHALIELASPSLPASIRQDFERMLQAGKRVTAPDIARARKAHPQNRKGRWPASENALAA
jgi:hypothetical protein